ncbi:hypothetical protein AB7C87_03335 [Natrarchaeobius sp. A-rgal3]|uniref:hypothetical protein n=1 Tax=Natrarchaeobius versutus TaxID=1679078 RepID=UPI003510C139
MSESPPADNDLSDLGPPEYLLYRVAAERHEQDGRETGRTRIHKLCCLADRLLAQEYVRKVGLPKYWYKYGRTISEAHLNSAVTYRPNANHFGGQAYYPADQISESHFDHLSEDLKDDIYNAVQSVVTEHGDKTAEELEEYQYQNFAPDDFVIAYADLRWYLNTVSQDKGQHRLSQFVAPDEKTHIEELLDEMLANFDEELYSEIHNIYLDWDDTMRLLVDIGRSPRELHDFTETFIEGTARIILRFEEHSNIDSETLENWREEKEKVRRDLQSRVTQKRKEALSERQPTSTLDSVSDSYNTAISEELDEL